MKRLLKTISFMMALLILFSSLQFPYFENETVPYVYAEEEGSDEMTVTESVYSDAEVVALDKDWLTGDMLMNGNSYVYQFGFYSGITGDLKLPVKGEKGSTISWESSDEAVIAAVPDPNPDSSNYIGKVTRPDYIQGNSGAYLTATLSCGEASEVKSFYIGVSCLEGTPDEVSVKADYGWLYDTVLTWGDGYTYFDALEVERLFVPGTGGEGPALRLPKIGEAAGSSISWVSSDTSVIAVIQSPVNMNDFLGKITVPTYAQGNKHVTVTATISKGSVQVDKVFEITVLAKATDEEKVALDKEWLTLESILGNNSADDVKTDLYLHDEGPNGSSIEWESSDNSALYLVFDSGTYPYYEHHYIGRVKRPVNEDVPVTLKATIHRGAAESQKSFDLVVRKKENAFLAAAFDDFGSTGSSLLLNGDVSIEDASIRFVSNENGGSVFTKNKIHLEDDMSFSTAFTFSIDDGVEPPGFALGDGGFTFTLQADDNTKYGTGSEAMGAAGIEPSLSIGFDTYYWAAQGGIRGTYTGVKVLINGEESCSKDIGFPPNGAPRYVWIEYNGTEKEMEIRMAGDAERPAEPSGTITGVDLTDIFKVDSTNVIRDLYAGFTGSAGNVWNSATGEIVKIWEWYFKNGLSPVDPDLYNLIDASCIALSADPAGGRPFSTVTAAVYGKYGPVEGIPVEFLTTFGSLDTSTATTDPEGKASVVLSTDLAGTAAVKAVVQGGASDSIEINLAISDTDIVEFDSRWLTDDLVLEYNSALNNITKDMYLPVKGINGSDISWISGNANIVKPETTAEGKGIGKVTTPSPAAGDQEVELKAAITKGSLTVEKVFTVTVRVKDGDTAAADRDWLTGELLLEDNSALDNVIRDLYLPLHGENGSEISWASSNEKVVKPEITAVDDGIGRVTRPAHTRGDQPVTLTATIIKGAVRLEKVFHITVRASEPTDSEAVAAVEKGLTDASILKGNSSLIDIKGDLVLPDKGLFGTTIKWTSDREAVVNAKGEVTRQSFTLGDAKVKLTATISRGTESVVKSFTLVVKCEAQTEAEAFAADCAWLDVFRTLGGNLSQYSICGNLQLPDKAPLGALITWTSGESGVISDSGVVTRPAYHIGHKSLTLTAVLKMGTDYTAEKVFEYTVLKVPDTDPPKMIGNSTEQGGSNVIPWNTKEITLTFDEEITQGLKVRHAWSRDYGIMLNGPDVPDIYASNYKNKLTIKLSDYMKPGTDYELVIPAGTVTDDFFNNQEEALKLSFRVEQKPVNIIEVVSSSPEENEKQVSAATSQISFGYNYDTIVKGGTFDNISLLDGLGSKISTAKSLNGDTVTLKFGAGTKLQPGTVYELVIPPGAVRDRFENESRGRNIKFRTENGNTVPQIVSTYPIDGQTDVNIHQKIEISFSEAVEASNCRLTLLDNKGNKVYAGIWTLNSQRKGAVIQPYGSLKPNTRYTLVGPYDSVSNPSGVEFRMSFTTGADLLSIDGHSVSGDGIPINTPIEIGFSDKIKRGPEFENIRIYDSQGNPAAFEFNEANNKAVLTPASELSPSEAYTFYIPKGAYKNESNRENDALKFRRTTADRRNYANNSFTVSPSSNWVTGKPLTFNTRWLEQISHPIKSMEWNFGDGYEGNGRSPQHTYGTAGDYKVTLTLTDSTDISYSFEQTVRIGSLEPGDISMSPYPGEHQYLTVYEKNNEYNIKNVAAFTIGLYSSSIGRIPGEKISVELHKNGENPIDLGTVTTGYNGTAAYNFWYGDKGYFGTYELVFTHNYMGVKNEARIPVTINEATDKQAMVIKLYNQYTGEFVVDKEDILVELNGVKRVAEYEWLEDGTGDCHIIKGLQTGKEYALKLAGSGEAPYMSDLNTILHNGSNYTVFIPVRRKEPGINYIRSALSDTALAGDSIIIQGIEIPGLTFEFDGEWDRLNPGYYELATNTGSISIKSEKPCIEFQPGLKMKPGERLRARMVSKSGVSSKWKDAEIMVAPKPSLGYGININLCYSDGVYQVDAPAEIMGLGGGKAGILDGVPLLDGGKNSFGFGGSSNRLWGTMNRHGYMKLNFEDSYKAGMETKKVNPAKKSKFTSTGYEVSADIYSGFYLYYNDETCEWDLLRGEFYLSGRGEYFWKKGLEIPHVPIGVSGKLAMGSNIDGTLIIDRSGSGEDKYSGIIGFEPYVEASLKAGATRLSVEGYVSGSVPAELHLPTGYMQVEPQINAGVTVEYLFDSDDVYKKKIAGTHWDNGKDKVLYSIAGDVSKQLVSELEEEDINLEPTPRNYLDRRAQSTEGSRESSEGLVRTGVSAASSYDASLKAAVSQKEFVSKNIYPRAEVQLVRSGDKLYAIWTDDNPDRDANNRTQLRYSVLKNGEWSQPAWLWQDGTADFSPAAAASGGGVLIAWQNISEPMQENNKFVSYIENSEITVTGSVYKAGGSDVELITLTEDDKLDHSPRIASDGDKALLVWTKSEGLGFTLGEETEGLQAPANSDSLYFSSWDGSTGTWSASAIIESGLPTVMDSSLAMHGEEGLLLYTLDMDSDQKTQEDQEVYCRIYDGDSWGQAVRMTNNQVQDSNPKAVCSNGEWFITWHRDGSIMYKAGMKAEAESSEFLSKVQNDYEIAVKDGTEPQIGLVYSQMSDNNTRTLSAVFYDIESGIWSDEIPLTEGEGYIRSLSPVFNGNGELNAAYTQAEVITEVVEGNEYLSVSDKADLRLLTYTPVHDLALDGEDSLQLSPENPLPGTRTKIYVTISNQGDFAERATIHIYDGSPEKGIIISEAATEQPIPARSSAQVEVEWLVDPEERYEYDIYAVVRPEGDITETDEDNNTIMRKLSTADIAVTGLGCENIAGYDYLVKATVANRGSRLLEGVKVRLGQAGNGKLLETSELGQVKAGQEIGLSFLISSQGLTPDENGEINMALSASAALPDGTQENSSDNNIYEFALEPAAITIDKMDPGAGETRIDVDKSLTLSFNMNVEAGAGFDKIVLTDAGLNNIDINKTLEGNTLTVIPKSAMAYNTGYTLTIPREAVSDSSGHAMKDAYSLSFTTTTSSPETVFSYPGNGMSNITLGEDIRVKYNQTILEGPTFESIALNGPDSKEISASVSLQGEWLNIRSTAPLGQNMLYSLSVPGGAVKNDKGEAQQEDYTLVFTTAEAENPGSDPGDDEDHDTEDRDGAQSSERSGAGQQAVEISRQTSADGRSTAVVNIAQQALSKLSAGTGAVFMLDLTDKVKSDQAIQVNLAESVLKQLAASGMGLSIVTGKGDITLPAGLVEALARVGKGAFSISIAQNNERLTDTSRVSAGVFDFTITAEGEPVISFEQAVIVTIPLDISRVGNAKRVIVCVYDEASGSWQPVGGVADAAGGSVTFHTKHFSTYAAFETVMHFDDVTSNWSKEKVEILASRRLISGKDSNTFAPEEGIKRAEFAAMAVRSLYTEPSIGKGTFEDVPKDAWFAASVKTAYELGLIMGSGNSKFNPYAQITREQLAAIVYRLYRYKKGAKTIESIGHTFKDRQDISSYAEEAVRFVANTGIMTGSGGMFEPGRSATRQEAAVALYRLLEYMGEL